MLATYYILHTTYYIIKQYGFRPRHSTEIAAVMESDHTPDNICVDLSNTVDTINVLYFIRQIKLL